MIFVRIVKSWALFSLALCVFGAPAAKAQEANRSQLAGQTQGGVVNLNTTVKGNQEHPSVTYIVPWREAGDNSPIEMPFTSKARFSDVFRHVERVEHKRHVEFLTQMQAGEKQESEN